MKLAYALRHTAKCAAHWEIRKAKKFGGNMNATIRNSRRNRHSGFALLLAVAVMVLLPRLVFAQLDQGAITGIVTDPKGAAVSHATVRLSEASTGLILSTQTDASGIYTFQPVKVGTYSITVIAPGFAIETENGVEVHVAARLEANIQLKVGNVTETLQVSAGSAPLLQTEEASTGQVISTKTVNDLPLNGRNYVFIAQEAAGIPPSNGSRGQGNGDFTANGMRATQNNFILDGVDNNSDAIDFLNGASYVVKPPPDALQEFKVQTGSFSAEFGHSAGAVVNASIKSGTNSLHGDAWEYVRNNDLGEASPTEWASGVTTPTTVLPYHQNQFGFTLGGPFIRNKLFFFGDYEGNRLSLSSPQILTVPTLLERTGNFTELLNTNLTGAAQPIVLYEPGSAGNEKLGSACGNAQNMMCANEISSIAQALLNLYPQPRGANADLTYNNYASSLGTTGSINQFDVRVDYNLSDKDQMFGRISRSRESRTAQAPLGSILDGSNCCFTGGIFANQGDNVMFSENHIFTPALVNQARFAYNWGYFNWLQFSANTNLAEQYGLGGIPYQPGNGGLPNTYINGIQGFGTPLFQPTPEHQNVYQIIDDLTWIRGNHAFKFGVDFQNIRYAVLQPTFAHTAPGYDGHFTASPGVAYTGSGVADFLADYMNTDASSSFIQHNLGRWYRAGYAQDDWKASRKLTVNLGVRWDFFEPSVERSDEQANFIPVGAINVPGTGTAHLLYPASQKNQTLNAAFVAQAAKDNVSIIYSGNRSLVNSQLTNFAPRVGFSYQASNRLVVRLGSGMFYGGIENLGNYPNLGANYPYDLELAWAAPSCNAGATSCATDGASLKNGPPTAGGFNPFDIGMAGFDASWHSPYTVEYNLATEYAFTDHMSLTVAYVGSVARHLQVVVWPNSSAAIAPAGTNTMSLQPFPDFGSIHNISAAAMSDYNGLQVTFQRHFNNGLGYLTTYTWSHSLDDSREPLPSNGEGGDKNYNMFGLGVDYADSPFDVRQRYTFVADYDLPFGVGRKYMTRPGALNLLAGGWSASMIFNAQAGEPFTVYDGGAISGGSLVGGISGASTFAIKTGNPWANGGSAPAGNPGTPCAANVKTIAHWYNPCAFSNPAYPTSFGTAGYITASQGALAYTGGRREQITEPGYERINMSVFKNFTTFREEYLQFRADVFNLFNTPAWGAPSNSGITGSNAGQITGTRFIQNFSPDPRFFQLALKYYF
jgi:Carboxypeptidase regulatory-like domain/TonB-dependent Receptor Plug Domain